MATSLWKTLAAFQVVSATISSLCQSILRCYNFCFVAKKLFSLGRTRTQIIGWPETPSGVGIFRGSRGWGHTKIPRMTLLRRPRSQGEGPAAALLTGNHITFMENATRTEASRMPGEFLLSEWCPRASESLPLCVEYKVSPSASRKRKLLEKLKHCLPGHNPDWVHGQRQASELFSGSGHWTLACWAGSWKDNTLGV